MKKKPTPEEFAELRRKRNESVRATVAKICAEHEWPVNESACDCACAIGGPCEHEWNGADYVSEDGCMQSVTCSRCGCTAISHDMRVVMP